MANSYQEDLKRIVGVTDKVAGIEQQTEKKEIPGGRGIVFFDGEGGSRATSGVMGETLQPGGEEANDSSGSNNGSYGGNTTGSAGIDAPYPVDDETDPNSGFYNSTELRLGNQVRGLLDLKDCATGAPVSIRFDGQFTAPLGWSDPCTAAMPEGYISGKYYYNGNKGAASTPGGVVVLFQAGATLGRTYSLGAKTGDDYCIAWSDTEGNSQSCSQIAYVQDCGGSTEDYCTTSPVPTEWPASQPMQLSYNSATGKYETHSLDPNVTPEYSQPVSSFDLCNQAGESVKSYPIATGGQAIYNSTTGIAAFIDRAGKVTGFGDAQAITNNLPR